MLKARVTAIIILSVVTLGLISLAINLNRDETTASAADDNFIREAIENLPDEYYIATSLSTPSSNYNFICVVDKNGCYSEHPVTSDSEEGSEEEQEVTYILNDWLTSDNKNYYMLNTDEEEFKFVSLPESYANEMKSRRVLYVDRLLGKFTEIKEAGVLDISFDNSGNQEPISTYSCKVKAEDIVDILGMNSTVLYSCVARETKDEDVNKYCNFCVENAKRLLTCSDANVTIGIDKNDTIKYIDINVAGAGSELQYTMTVIQKVPDEFKMEKPSELENAITFESTITDIARFAAKYDTYEDALNALKGDISD